MTHPLLYAGAITAGYLAARGRSGRRADGPILIDSATGKTLKVGDTLTDFRGEKSVLTGMTPPHKPSSTGRVFVAEDWGDGKKHEGSYFPGVFNAEWKYAQGNRAGRGRRADEIALPKSRGTVVTVRGPRGEVAKLKYVKSGSYILMMGQQSRWGNASQIRQDIAHFQMSGKLPYSGGGWSNKGRRSEDRFRVGEILILDSPHTRGIPELENQEVNFRGYLGATDAVVVAPEGGQMSVPKAWLSRKKGRSARRLSGADPELTDLADELGEAHGYPRTTVFPSAGAKGGYVTTFEVPRGFPAAPRGAQTKIRNALKKAGWEVKADMPREIWGANRADFFSVVVVPSVTGRKARGRRAGRRAIRRFESL